jgi:DNA-directed RNA polymerase subunit RPC12/RpoP
MKWDEFPEGEEPEILTGISEPCNEGKHGECPGHAESEEHGGQTVFCVCDCHRVREEDLPPELRADAGDPRYPDYPIVPHNVLEGAEDCDGCFIARDGADGQADIKCNACGFVVATVPRAEVAAKLAAIVGGKVTWATCPHCGQANSFPGFSQMLAYVCQHCGQGVDATPRIQ